MTDLFKFQKDSVNKPLMIAIAGGTASGKTTFTKKLVQHMHI